MFIRAYTTTNKKTGAKYTSHRLVESYRTEKGPRQRVVMHLGTIQLPKASWPKLATALEARLSGHRSAFEEEPEIAKATEEAMSYYHYRQLKEAEKQKREAEIRFANVNLASLSVVETRTLGPELIAHTIWQQLQVDEILANLGFTQSQRSLTQALVLGRLLAPELKLGVWLKEQSALTELLPGNFATDTFACQEVAARLYLHKETLEGALWRREFEFFGPNNHLLIFSPSSHLTMAVDARGFPSWSFLGSQKLGPEQLDLILERHSGLLPTVTLHRELATEENQKFLSSRTCPQLLVYYEPSSTLVPGSIAGSSFTEQGSVQIWQYRNQQGLFIHCSQDSTQELDLAQEQLFLAQVDKLQSLLKNRKLSSQAVQRRLVALKEQFPTVAAFYKLELELGQHKEQNILVQKQLPRRGQISGYVFQTQEHPLDQREAHAQYQTLTRMTTAFHSHNFLGETELFLSVIAYHLLVTIEHQLENAECNLTWQEARAAVSTHQRTTITFTDDQDNRHRLRTSTMAEGNKHHEIYRILKVADPLEKL